MEKEVDSRTIEWQIGKRAAEEFLRASQLNPKSLRRRSEVLGEPNVCIANIHDCYLLAAAVIKRDGEDDVGNFDEDELLLEPGEFILPLYADLISIEHQQIVGSSVNEIYQLPDMVSLFSPDEIFECLDSQSQAHLNLYAEMTSRRSLRFLLNCPDGNLLHLDRLTIDEAHRGRGLGLLALTAVIELAVSAFQCTAAIMKPFPLQFESSRPHDSSLTLRWRKDFNAARRKLLDYYAQLGFVAPSLKSDYLFRRFGE